MYLSALTDPVTQKYFESSVYRNLLGMIATINEIHDRLWLYSKISILTSNPLVIYECDGNNVYHPMSPSDKTRVFAIGRGAPFYGGGRTSKAWYWLVTPLTHGKRIETVKFPTFYNFTKLNQALMNFKTVSLDFKARIRGLEWELNRVHLPMVDGLLKWASTIDDYVASLPNGIREIPRRGCSDDGFKSYELSLDNTRIASYFIALELAKMPAWLTTMKAKVIERDRTDQAALIAIEKQKTAEAKAALIKERARLVKIAADAAVKKQKEQVPEKVTINNSASKVVQTKSGKGALIVTGTVVALLTFLQ